MTIGQRTKKESAPCPRVGAGPADVGTAVSEPGVARDLATRGGAGDGLAGERGPWETAPADEPPWVRREVADGARVAAAPGSSPCALPMPAIESLAREGLGVAREAAAAVGTRGEAWDSLASRAAAVAEVDGPTGRLLRSLLRSAAMAIVATIATPATPATIRAAGHRRMGKARVRGVGGDGALCCGDASLPDEDRAGGRIGAVCLEP